MKSKKSLGMGLLVLIFGLVVITLSYQNCGNALSPAVERSSTSPSTGLGTSTGNPPVPAPVVAAILSLSDSKGPLFGDVSLAITGQDIPLDKKVSVNFGNIPCLNLVVVDSKTITCITPPSAAAAKVDVSLLVEGVVVSKLAMAYEFAASEMIKNIAANNVTGPRIYSTAVYESGNVYFWGGEDSANQNVVAQGVVYDEVNDAWSAMSTAGQSKPTVGPAAASTGSELIVFGGNDGTAFTNAGSAYNYSTKTWKAISSTNAPTARGYATAIWTGSKMLVWGGLIDATNYINTGAAYDPKTDTWTAMALPGGNIAARGFHFAFWTGKEMGVYGGYFQNNLQTGLSVAYYNPATDAWRRVDYANGYSNYSIDVGWGFYAGTRFIIQGVKFNAANDFSTPKYINDAATAWTDLPLGMLPVISPGNNSVDRYQSVWTGRYLVLIKDGSSGYRYSFN